MGATVRSITPRPKVPPRVPEPPRQPRRPVRDNPRLLLLGIVLLLGALVAMIALADRSAELSPDFLSEVVLYALAAADVTMLVALLFVLARNIIKLLVERRRALPFARFRAKLVAAMLGLTLIPALLVLLVGSELIRNSADRWFSAPIDEVLSSATSIARDYYRDREQALSSHAAGIARALEPFALDSGDVTALQDIVAAQLTQRRIGLIEVYRIVGSGTNVTSGGGGAPPLNPGGGGAPPLKLVEPVVDAAAPGLPRGYSSASADRLAARVASGSRDTQAVEPLTEGAELVRAAAIIRGAGGQPAGVVIASERLAGDVATKARRITEAYEGYNQLRVLKAPLAGVYLSFFLMMTLMILVSATWMGLYLAKRITRPVHLLAGAAREIGAGHLDHRVERETTDEFGSLVDAFNSMAGELAASQRKLERSRVNLERKHDEVEERRRYIATILERIATGVVSIDREGRLTTVNGAATRLLGIEAAVAGQPAAAVFAGGDLQPIADVLTRLQSGGRDVAPQEIATARDGRELHLAVAATPLHAEDGSPDGAVIVFEDVTPLIRTQRVAAWRDVARRLAHEIKNPLTPIQLCAERLRRHFAGAVPATRALVDECSGTIVGEVESLKALVDEFSQFARMPAPRAVPSDVHALLNDCLALYSGLFQGIRIERRFAPELPRVRMDPEQIRRVVINLIDNAVEALSDRGPGADRGADLDRGAGLSGPRSGPAGSARLEKEGGVIELATEHDPVNGIVRILVSDNGPGIPPADREKLFMPYYSTKRRGSGLGLAIVRRIVAEHGGSIEAGDNVPHGTRFTIELPC